MSLLRPVRKLARIAEEFISAEPTGRRRKKYNPARPVQRPSPDGAIKLTRFSYDAYHLTEESVSQEKAIQFPEQQVSWLNVDGVNKSLLETLAKHFKIHALLIEDIQNVGQRAKMDEIGNMVFCLLPMLYYNENTGMVECEQVSLVLVPGGVISFQEEAERDVFDPIRIRLRSGGSKLRTGTADFLLYTLLDVIVDSYFGIMERLDQRAERLEEEILQDRRGASAAKIALLRREILTVARAIAPVREVINGLISCDSTLMENTNEKYYKDILDHILHAMDNAESMRDGTTTLLELTFNQVNMRTNEIVKVFTIITTLLAPATVIGGIFGMNFDIIPLAHQKDGFIIMVTLMFIIPLFMLIWFKRKNWF
ncbi:MAG: magnesium/cobalt transporter CorA [Sphingobacteriales bacterium]|nr:MAG: magnesium/cobalt transporter CorA [Sphingobacteriales bacterium]